MSITAERLERYRDFVDPDNTGASYDQRKGLERLLGVLSPDPKGVVLAAMDTDWYGSHSQLRSRIFAWLTDLNLPFRVWPITSQAAWSYIQTQDHQSSEYIDGSLVHLGSVVKKIEQDSFQSLYQRSLAGAELAMPLVQQAVTFVIEARKYAERQMLNGKEFPKFDSLWRLLGALNSSLG